MDPLTAEHKAEIDRQLEAIKEAEALVKRAEAAGIDVADQKAALATLRDQLTRLRSAFFPTGR